MTAASIISISNLLDNKYNELKAKVENARREYLQDETITYNTYGDSVDDKQIVELLHSFNSYKNWNKFAKELRDIECARDDFNSHDFH